MVHAFYTWLIDPKAFLFIGQIVFQEASPTSLAVWNTVRALGYIVSVSSLRTRPVSGILTCTSHGTHVSPQIRGS